MVWSGLGGNKNVNNLAGSVCHRMYSQVTVHFLNT